MSLTLMNGTGYPANTGGDPPGYGDDRGSTPPSPRRRLARASTMRRRLRHGDADGTTPKSWRP